MFIVDSCAFLSSNTDFIFITTSTVFVKSSNFTGDPLVAWRGLRFSYTTMNISNTSFNSFYEDSVGLVGAGVYSLSSNTYIYKSVFMNNIATNGASIYYDCSDTAKCIYVISNSNFTNNIALNNGASF